MDSDQVKAADGTRLARASVPAIAIRAIGATCGLLFNVVLARSLGNAGTGSVLFYLNFATMVGLIATGGLDVVGLRELSRAADDRSRIAVVLTDLVSSAVPSLALFSVGSFIFLLLCGSSLAGTTNVWICAICALMLCLTALQKMLSDWLVALREFAASQLAFYFLNRVVSLILIAAIIGLTVGARVPGTFIGTYVAGLLVAVAYATRRISAHTCGRLAFPRRPVVSLVRDGMSCATQNAGFVLLNLSPFLLLGALSNASEIGLFGVSQRLVAVVILALTTISQLAMRDFSRAFGDGDFVALARALTTSTRLTVLAAIALTLLLVVFAPFWVLIFGKSFAAAAPILALLSIAICAQCLGMPFQAALLTTNHERLARDITLVCALIGIALNCVLIPRFGAPGAALGTGVGLALQSIGHAVGTFCTLPLRFLLPAFAIIPRRASQGIR